MLPQKSRHFLRQVIWTLCAKEIKTGVADLTNEKQEFAVKALTVWYQENLDVLKKIFNSVEIINSGHDSVGVKLESGQYLVDISAWNHASCLDIQILEVESEESNFLHVGDCNSKEEFEIHLGKFMEWLDNECKCRT